MYLDLTINNQRSTIRETYYDPISNKVCYRENFFSPSLFFPTKDSTEFKDIYGVNQYEYQFDTIRQYNEKLKEVKSISGFEYNGDISHTIKYIHDNYNYDIDFDVNKINIANIDIETRSTNGFPDYKNPQAEIYSITIYFSKTNMYYVLGFKDLINPLIDNKKYIKCDNECDLLQKFVFLWLDNRPQVVTGWNIDRFDIPYLVNRMYNIIGEELTKELSPFKTITVNEKYKDFDKTYYERYKIHGVLLLDYMRLYKKYTYENQESYSLNNISLIELEDEKIDYSEYKNLDRLYEENYEMFIEYNIKDVELVNKLDDKLKFIDLHFIASYVAKVSLDDSWKSSVIWDGLLYNNLINQGIVVPKRKEKDDDDNDGYEGAYIKTPIAGLHDWIMSFDVNSLYPNLIISFNISPDTLIKHDEKYRLKDDYAINNDSLSVNENYSYTINGCFFSREKQGFIPAMMEYLYNKRKEYQKEYKKYAKEYEADKSKKLLNLKSKYYNLQYAFKIILNSGYGVLGNEYFRFYDVNIAEAVTCMGRILIRSVERSLNTTLSKHFGEKDYIIYIDTDSCMISVKDILFSKFKNIPDKTQVLDFLYQAEDYLSEIINNSLVSYSNKFNAFKNTFKMSREKICDKVLYVKKKKYILRVIDNEKIIYDKPKYVIKGIEIVRKDTPKILREKLKEVVSMIFDVTDNSILKKYVNDYYNEYINYNVEDIAKPSGINNIDKYFIDKREHALGGSSISYKKGTPIHVRGSILYNKILLDKNLKMKYNIIREHDKIRTVYLKLPNPIKENVISFLVDESLPKEFGLHRFIDYELQYEKTFKNPILNIISAMGWNLDIERKECSIISLL